MPDINKKVRMVAIMGFGRKPSKVPARIITCRNTNTAMGTSGDGLVTQQVLTTQSEHIDDCETKQAAMKGGPANKKTTRDLSFDTMYYDRFVDMGLVKAKADKETDPVVAKDIINRNGFDCKKTIVPPAKQDISADNKKDEPGTIICNQKAPNTKKKVSYDWESSSDGGKTWDKQDSSPTSKTDIPGFKSAVVIIIRGRYHISGSPPSPWKLAQPFAIVYYQQDED